MWLSHHYPEDYDRCVRIGRSHVCRRCVVIYPIAAVVLALSAVGSGFSSGLTAAASIVLPLPTVVEWVLEHAGTIAYSPRRQLAVSVPMGLALGMGTVRYFADHLDPLALAVVAVYGTTCMVTALVLPGRSSDGGDDG